MLMILREFSLEFVYSTKDFIPTHELLDEMITGEILWWCLLTFPKKIKFKASSRNFLPIPVGFSLFGDFGCVLEQFFRPESVSRSEIVF